MTVATTTKAASTPQLLNPVSDRKPGRSLATKLIIAAEWLALLAGVSYLCVRTLPRAWQKLDTDFPNYYLTARLLNEGYDTDRIYEWIWIQRQKDHIKIEKSDQAVVAFVSLTPFSALLVWPLTAWTRHCQRNISESLSTSTMRSFAVQGRLTNGSVRWGMESVAKKNEFCRR